MSNIRWSVEKGVYSRASVRELYTPDWYGFLPIHEVAYHDRGPAIVEYLATKAPKTLHEYDNNRKMPIHYIAEYGEYFQTIKAFVDADPTTLSKPDGNGDLPIHIAVIHSKPEEVV